MTGRTLVVTNDFPPRHGGIETYVRQLCDELGAEDVVVHTASQEGDAAYDAAQPFPVVRDPARVLLPTRAVAERVRATARRHGCTRVVFGAAAPLGLLAPALRREGVAEVVAMTHGHEVWWARLPGTRTLLRRIGDGADTITCVSDYTRARIAPALSADAARRLKLRAPRVDVSRFRPGCGGDEVRRRYGIAPDALVVVCLSRLVRRKGQDTLVRIWPEVLREFPSARLLLVGEGPDRSRIERLVRRHGVGASVLMTGAVPDEEVPAHLDAGDIFAMPARSRLLGLEVEAFGIVYLEAAACGLRVVGGRSGGVAEALAAGAALRASPDERHVGAGA